ncbi:MAG: C40 family peptidase [Balneolaceae bacterium]|nr:C40 family peptidase [Balneolaceae bacterium]
MNSSFLLHFLLFGLIAALLSGCGVYRTGSQAPAGSTDRPPMMTVVTDEAVSSVQQQLNSAHNEWQGTPYRLGGSSQNGVDCSAFTQIVFRDFFELNLPRHTSEQIQAGTGIRRSAIQPGDLIFFRTSRGVLHVGIAMGGGDFLHASLSSGVMISNISQSYWAGRYLGARRVF